MKMDKCPLCETIQLCNTQSYPFLIHEFENSFWVLGNHQFFPGYSLLLLKQHARELHELDAKIQTTLHQELMLAGKTIAQTFQPWKMNYASYGNQVEHIHWHIIPRYADDPSRHLPPFNLADHFKEVPTTLEIAAEKIAKIQKILHSL